MGAGKEMPNKVRSVIITRPNDTVSDKNAAVGEVSGKKRAAGLSLESEHKHAKVVWNAPPKNRPVRVYADGIFDMFHAGHAKMLEQAKKLFPNVHLIVGVCNDELTHKMKGNTVFNEEERYESVSHCRWVDEIVTDAPWVVGEDFLAKHSIDYIAHDGDPYPNPHDEHDVYKLVKEKGMFVPTRRTEGISTTDIIVRIIQRYDDFIKRNINRGVSREKMNVSWLNMQRINMENGVHELQQGFIDLFGPSGKISRAFNDFARNSSL